MGTQLPLPKKGAKPQTAAWIKMKLGTEVGLGLGHTVLDGDPVPPPSKGDNPQFSAHVYCGQMAGWIPMPLGTEVGLGPGHIVIYGDPAHPPPKKKGGTATSPEILVPCLLWQNSWMEQDVTWYGGRPRPRHIVLDGA